MRIVGIIGIDQVKLAPLCVIKLSYMTRPILLSVNNYYYNRGGAEGVFLGHNRLFEEAGGQVVPFAMQHPENRPSDWDAYFVDELEYGSEYSFLQKAWRVPKAIYSLEARRKIELLLNKCQPDICHAHNLYHHISPSILSVLSKRQIPTVITLHDLKLACPAYKMLAPDGVCERCKGGQHFNVVRQKCIKNSRLLSSIVYMESKLHSLLNTYQAHVDRFVVPSKFYIEKFVEWGISREKMVHIPNFSSFEASSSSQPGDMITYFGRLGHEKGLETLIRAAAQADVPLRIIGTGPDEESLRSLAARESVQVEFSGYLTGQALKQKLRLSKVVVLPSEWFENAPLSVLEAYSMEIPVIGADIGGIPEMILEGETGATFASGNVTQLAEKLTWISEMESAECHAMGVAGREFLVREFTREKYQSRIFALYAELGVDISSLATGTLESTVAR